MCLLRTQTAPSILVEIETNVRGMKFLPLISFTWALVSTTWNVESVKLDGIIQQNFICTANYEQYLVIDARNTNSKSILILYEGKKYWKTMPSIQGRNTAEQLKQGCIAPSASRIWAFLFQAIHLCHNKRYTILLIQL